MLARLGLASLVLALAACTVSVTPSGAPVQREVSAKQPTPAPRVESVIEGVVRAPAGIIAAGGGNLIGQAGGSLIGQAGGNIIGHDSGSFAPRQLLAVAETPLAGVEVYLADAAGQKIPGLPAVKTDAEGRYTLPDVPAGHTFLVVARVQNAAGEEAYLKTLTRSSKVGATAPIDTATTFVSVAALEGANELGELNLSIFQRAVTTTGKHLETATLPDLADQDAVAAFMRDLSEEVAALKETVTQLKKDLAMVLERLDELEAKEPTPTPAPSTAPVVPATPTPTPQATATPLEGGAPVPATGWTVRTLAGSGGPAFVDGQGRAAGFFLPRGIGLGPEGVVYVADAGNKRIRRVDAEGHVTTLAGNGETGKISGPTAALAAKFSQPWDVLRDASDRLFVTDAGNQLVNMIAAGEVSILAGNGSSTVTVDGTGTVARFLAPRGLAITGTGGLLVADSGSRGDAIRTLTAAGVVGTFADSAGTFAGSVSGVRDMTVDGGGNVYAVQEGLHCVVRITPEGTVTTIAGQAGSSGSADGPGTAARFSSPTGIARDASGNLYVADYGNHRIRRIAPDGSVTTIAGSEGGSQDGPSESATLYYPYDVEVDEAGTLYVSEHRGHRVRVIEKQ